MSNFSKTLRAANTAASIVIAIGVAVDLYDRSDVLQDSPI